MAGSGPEATAFGPSSTVSYPPPEALNPVPARNSHRLDRRGVTRIQRSSVRGLNAGSDRQGNRQLARIASVDPGEMQSGIKRFDRRIIHANRIVQLGGE